MTDLTIKSAFTMNDGNLIPLLGFGVFMIKDPATCEAAVTQALKAGYRHIDTAHVYGNEESVGNAVAKSGLAREDIFITTKTVMEHNGQRIREVLSESLVKLQSDYVDLLLIHWPLNDEGISGAWETLQRLKEEGLCRSVGVSNFTVRRFEEVLLRDSPPLPAVNQIELHVYNQRPELVNYCREKGIALEAYSPLTRGKRLADPGKILSDIAEEHGKTVPQVMIRFLLEQDIVTLVKSGTLSRIRENADVYDFELTEKQMTALKGLDEGLIVQDWFPKGYY